MANHLTEVEFEESLLQVVQSFHCGDNAWDTELAEWLKQPADKPGALWEMAHGRRPPKVWLHFDEDLNLVGYSSLGETNWPGKPRLSVIPNVAVASAHQGKGYFTEIMNHLIHVAQEQATMVDGRLPILALFVHPENQKAIDIYTHFKFEPSCQTYLDRSSGVMYQGMLRRID